jgi:hypothetical protein
MLCFNSFEKVTIDASYLYCSYRQDDSSFFGLNQDHKEVYETIVGRSGIISQQGENVISSEAGFTHSNRHRKMALTSTLERMPNFMI